jgi:hypothetical protein
MTIPAATFNLAPSETHRTRFIYIFENTTPRKMVFEDYRNRIFGYERWARPVSWGGRTGLPPTDEVFRNAKCKILKYIASKILKF